MKKRNKSAKAVRREIFVLTLEEKRTIAFVLIALILGLTTKCYRDHHPVPPAKPQLNAKGGASDKEHKEHKGH